MDISAQAAAGTPTRYWGGLYSFKSWYAGRLAPVRRCLVAANIPPAAVTMTGIVFGAGAGAGIALALLRPGPVTGTAVAAPLAARLACANLDSGSVLNELGDRAAELAALAGCLRSLRPRCPGGGARRHAAAVGGAGRRGGQPAPDTGQSGRQDRTRASRSWRSWTFRRAGATRTAACRSRWPVRRNSGRPRAGGRGVRRAVPEVLPGLSNDLGGGLHRRAVGGDRRLVVTRQ